MPLDLNNLNLDDLAPQKPSLQVRESINSDSKPCRELSTRQWARCKGLYTCQQHDCKRDCERTAK